MRLGAPIPKALVHVAGRPMLWYAVSTALACPQTAHLVVVAPASHVAEFLRLVSPLGEAAAVPVSVVAGGAERGDSVLAGVHALPGDLGTVLVHDAARAFAPQRLFNEVVIAVGSGHPAVVPGQPVVDTIKEVDAAGTVVRTPFRTSLRAIQTPQGFERSVLLRAHEGGSSATDDAELVERVGVPVLVVPGDPAAFKVTTRADLTHAEGIAAAYPAPAQRP